MFLVWKSEITCRFSKILESTYEGAQSWKVAAGFQPATLLKIEYLIDMKSKDFRDAFTKICLILSIYLISVDSCSYSNNWITQLFESI